MSDKRLVLEVLNGPLDGHMVQFEKDAQWGKKGDGPLVFPWDKEMGEPQARFFYESNEWQLEGIKSQHGTYRLNRQERIEGIIKIEKGDILKASETWLLVHKIE